MTGAKWVAKRGKAGANKRTVLCKYCHRPVDIVRMAGVGVKQRIKRKCCEGVK